jgi:hypothetical protein
VQLPALSTLASIASIASTAPPAEASTNHGYVITRTKTLDTTMWFFDKVGLSL